MRKLKELKREGSSYKLSYFFIKIKRIKYWSNFIYRLGIYILLFGLGLVFIFPFLYMIVTSLKSPDDLIDITVRWIPKTIYWSNYLVASGALKYFTYLKNSIFVTVLCVIGHNISCSYIAYGYSRFKFKGRDFLFMFVLLSIIIPPEVLVTPLYIQYSKFRWINTYLPLIVPSFLGFGLRGGLYIFIFRQFFLGLPKDLENAALIDGCGCIQTFWRIIFPVAKAPILVSSVLSMIWHWNDSFEATLYLTSSKKWFLPTMLPKMYDTLKSLQPDDMMAAIFYNEGVIMAGTFLTVLPLLLAYLFLQRQFMEGIERSGLVE
ncbi:MAG TPA: carbohydrate ABC transporter permease [Clostridiales bacterium]|nr:carbohydrate ABC transporter permease [Clostridiales bacterium]